MPVRDEGPLCDSQSIYYVYILGSISGTLYVGMTNNLHRRVWQHKQHEIEGFTKDYEIDVCCTGLALMMCETR